MPSVYQAYGCKRCQLLEYGLDTYPSKTFHEWCYQNLLGGFACSLALEF